MGEERPLDASPCLGGVGGDHLDPSCFMARPNWVNGLVRIRPVRASLRQVEHDHGRATSHRRSRRPEEYGARAVGRDSHQAIRSGARSGMPLRALPAFAAGTNVLTRRTRYGPSGDGHDSFEPQMPLDAGEFRPVHLHVCGREEQKPIDIQAMQTAMICPELLILCRGVVQVIILPVLCSLKRRLGGKAIFGVLVYPHPG